MGDREAWFPPRFAPSIPQVIPVPPGQAAPAVDTHGTTVIAVKYKGGVLNVGDRRATAADPQWAGDDDSPHSGITDFSLAAYYRRRPRLRGRVAGARGRPRERGCFGVVELLDEAGRPLAVYRGFAWGYRGEGPSGLAALLADALPVLFPSYEAALAFVSSLPQEEPWTTPPAPREGTAP